jgi:N-acetylmuramoyl-L-alanine amidase
MYNFVQAACYRRQRREEVDMVVIHFTAAGTLAGTISWFKNTASRASAHYIIGRDGTVVQMVREGDEAWHAGESSWNGRADCNRRSIGIELVNWGNVKLINGMYKCWPDNWSRKYDTVEFGYPSKIGEWWWAPYSASQLKACYGLVSELRSRYKIPEVNIVGHSDISPSRKIDPGPMISMEKLKKDSRPKSLVLPDEAYQDDPTDKDYLNRGSDRSGQTSWMDNLLVLIRRK